MEMRKLVRDRAELYSAAVKRRRQRRTEHQRAYTSQPFALGNDKP
jgi:hypothetical protein